MFPSGHLFLILLLAQLWLFVHNDCMPLPNEKRMPNVEAATHTKSKPASCDHRSNCWHQKTKNKCNIQAYDRLRALNLIIFQWWDMGGSLEQQPHVTIHIHLTSSREITTRCSNWCFQAGTFFSSCCSHSYGYSSTTTACHFQTKNECQTSKLPHTQKVNLPDHRSNCWHQKTKNKCNIQAYDRLRALNLIIFPSHYPRQVVLSRVGYKWL